MADVASSPASRPDGGGRSWPRRRWLVGVVGAAAVMLLIVAALGSWMVRDAGRAQEELTQAAELVRTLTTQLTAGDTAAARDTLEQVQRRAAQARDDLDGPHWTLASHLPTLGRQVVAARTIAEVVDGLATDTLPGLVATVAALETVTGPSGLNLRPLLAAGPAISAADRSVAEAQRQIATLDLADLDARLADPVGQLRAELTDLRTTTAAAARATTVLPGLLGVQSPRRYLLLVQNNAEVRATGGLLGFVATLEARDGTVELTGSRAGSSIPSLARPILPLTAQERDVFGPQLGQHFVDANLTPHFPRTAELVAAWWRRETGASIDGVFSIDPVALAGVLGATGPVPLPGGEQLTADNAVRLLLHEVYLRLPDPAEQDAYFAAAAGAVFRALTGGQGDTLAAVRALAEAAAQGRVYAWSAHEQEQAQLAGTDLAGELTGARGDAPLVGVYLNDGSGAKMSYYLDAGVTVAQRCVPQGQRLTVTVTLHSNAPADAARLPDYVTGGGSYVPRGRTYTTVSIVSPAGGAVARLGDPRAFTVTSYADMAVALGTVDLAPGQTTTVTVVLDAPQAGPPQVRRTPGVRDAPPTIVGAACADAS